MPFLNTQDRTELLDFMDAVTEYLPQDERVRAWGILEEKPDASLSQAELAGRVLQQAVLSWPARRAIQRYVEAEGAEAEWDKLLETVRPTTGFLLKRARERVGARTLSQLLETEDISSVLQGEERTELELVRPEVWIELWRSQPETLIAHINEANKELAMMHERLQKLEQFSTQTDKQAALKQKIAEFQDRIYFGGESIPLEQLDEELQLTIGDVLGQ